MAKKELQEELEIPEGVTVVTEGDSLVVNGPKGSVKRKYDHPKINVTVSQDKVLFIAKEASKREKAVIKTYVAHMKNAFAGVIENFVYRLKVCSGHFPMTVTVQNDLLTIKNFLGEKIPRKVVIKDGVKIKVDGAEITVESADRERAGQVSADIEQATRRAGFDRRIFQDGIYIIEKAGKKI